MTTMPYIPPSVASVELIVRYPSGASLVMTSDQIISFDSSRVTSDGWMTEYETTIKAGRWTVQEKEAPVANREREVGELEPGDESVTFGKVVKRGALKFIGGTAYIPVEFDKAGLRIFKSSETFLVKGVAVAGVVPDSHNINPNRELHVEKSINEDPGELYLKVVDTKDRKNNRGIWVRKSELLEAIENPKDPR